MYIPREIIEEIRERASIEDLIKRYLPTLKKKGKNYLGLCPFHKEKTPSFTVSPEKKIFHCFGCNESGNVFTFIQKMERLDFPESVKFIADIVGIELRIENNTEYSQEFEEINRLNSYTSKLYNNYLKSNDGTKGLKYLLKRGVSEKSIEEFDIGFAPESWDFVTKSLIKKKADLQLAEKIGLIGTSNKSRGSGYFDKYRNRIIFPIFNKKSQVIAFGGRLIDDNSEDKRKYINSPESSVFKKRNVLYGFNIAKDAIRDLNRAIIVEGYLDVIGCHQAGINNVVAPLGTALTEDQLRTLAKFCNEIILLFDADAAGIKAASRSLDIADELSVEIKIAMLPELDPFEYIQKKGIREFMVVVDKAQLPVDFRISRVMSEFEKNGKINTLIRLFTIIKELNYESEKSIYIKKISTLLDIDENSIRSDFLHFLNKGDIQSKSSEDKKADDFITRSYRDLITLICNYPELIERASFDFPVNDIPDRLSKNILKGILEIHGSGESFSIDKMFDFFTDDIELDFLNEIVSSNYQIESPNDAYTEIYVVMKIHEMETKRKLLFNKMKNSSNNENEYLAEMEILKREEEKLSKYLIKRNKV
ncbi:DNA primase [Spirochaetota bacterium]